MIFWIISCIIVSLAMANIIYNTPGILLLGRGWYPGQALCDMLYEDRLEEQKKRTRKMFDIHESLRNRRPKRVHEAQALARKTTSLYGSIESFGLGGGAWLQRCPVGEGDGRYRTSLRSGVSFRRYHNQYIRHRNIGVNHDRNH